MSQNIRHKYITKRIVYIIAFLTALAAVISVLFMYHRVGSSLIHRRNVDQIDISLNPKEFPFEEITFESRLGHVNLHGVFFSARPPSNKTLLLVHGFDENRMMAGRTEKIVEYLIPQGYNIMTFDLRGQGESEGDFISFGYYEKYDLLGAVDYVKQRGTEGEKIGVLGFSMGAATAILAADEGELDAVIADSTFSDFSDFITNGLDRLPSNLNLLSSNLGDLSYWSVLRHFPCRDWFVDYYAQKYKININEISPIKAVRKMKEKPILLIHGKRDRLISCTDSEALYNCLSYNPHALLWLTERAGHVESLRLYPDQYLTKVKLFLDTSLR